MKKLTIGCAAVLLALAGCGGSGGGSDNKPTPNVTFAGHIQKGPFLQGGTVEVHGLDSALNPTGATFSTVTDDDLGSFSVVVSGISPFFEIITSGFYFDEVNGRLSTSPITLRSLTGPSALQNVNVLTSLARKRVLKLAAGGLGLAGARTQAEAEVAASLLGASTPLDAFSSLDISLVGGSNSGLLASSALLQQAATLKAGASGNVDAQLSTLLSELSNDLETDGSLDGQSLKDILSDAESTLDRSAVINSLKGKYGDSPFTFGGHLARPGLPQRWSRLDLSATGNYPQVLSDGADIYVVFVGPQEVVNGDSSVTILPNQLIVATISGTAATYEYFSPGEGNEPRARLDKDNNLHIVHGRDYLTNRSGSWLQEKYVAAGTVNSTDLALDSNGVAHVAFLDEGSNMVRYATNQSGAWVAEDVAQTALNLGDSTIDHTLSLAIDANDKLHLVYNDRGRTTPGLRYAVKETTGWSVTTLEAGSYVGMFSDVECEGDTVHISYNDRTGGALKLKYRTSADAFATAKILANDGFKASIGVYDQQPQILYYSSSDAVTYLTPLKTTTYLKTVKTAASMPSLFIDGSGAARFAWRDGTTGAITVALPGETDTVTVLE